MDEQPGPPEDSSQDGTIQPAEPEQAEDVQPEQDIEDRPEDAIQDQTDPGAFELPALADFGINSDSQSDADLPGFDADDETDERLSALEDAVQQMPQPPFFPGVAIFQQGTGGTYSELVPLNNTLSLAGTGSFVYTGTGSTGTAAITLSSTQFVAVLIPDNGTSTSNIAVVKIGGGGSPTADFKVAVKQNGTSGGLPAYDLYSLSDTTSKLNTGSPLAPQDSRARINSSLSVTAPADYTPGDAYYDAAGNIQLWDVPETVCSSAATLGVYP